jgi:competence CoiA-like predicted nuclease
MIYAISTDGIKIKAIPNEIAICPICKSELKSKCGQLNIWHWAHKDLKDCDSWNYEPISEWHLKWQNYFGEEQREVLITKGDETHIADIVTEKGTIIEIQNSNISVDDIFDREVFYRDMIWVLNTVDFKHNLYFKNFPPFPFEPVWKQYIQKQVHSDTIGFKITIPVNDINNQILSALKKCNYICESDDTIDSEYWYNLKQSQHEELDKLIINAFEGYLIDSKFSTELEENKIYSTNFKWTHLRKTWRTSTKPIFLDLNNAFLFLIKTLHENGNGFGKLVPKRLFLKKYRS